MYCTEKAFLQGLTHVLPLLVVVSRSRINKSADRIISACKMLNSSIRVAQHGVVEYMYRDDWFKSAPGHLIKKGESFNPLETLDFDVKTHTVTVHDPHYTINKEETFFCESCNFRRKYLVSSSSDTTGPV